MTPAGHPTAPDPPFRVTGGAVVLGGEPVLQDVDLTV